MGLVVRFDVPLLLVGDGVDVPDDPDSSSVFGTVDPTAPSPLIQASKQQESSIRTKINALCGCLSYFSSIFDRIMIVVLLENWRCCSERVSETRQKEFFNRGKQQGLF